MNKFFLLAIIFITTLMPFSAFGFAKIVGTYGKTYKFAENNLMQVVKNKAKNFDWKAYYKAQKMKQKIEDYQPLSQEVNLPNAFHTLVFEPNMYYTLDRSIKNIKGTVIYPKGFRFKITDYISLKQILVVINGDSAKQVEWFKHSKYFNNIDVMFLITKGNYYRLEKKFKIPVFYYIKGLQRRFKVRATPSVIWQKGNILYVKQFGLYHKKKS